MCQQEGRGRILIVDDDPVFCSIMKELLRRHGYRSSIAYSVPEALETLRDCVPDLVLTDIMMPEVDGLTLLRYLRADPQLSSVPTVVVSARVMEADQRAAREAGADEFIEKPFSMQRLRKTINGYLAAA
ncbi:MAG: response regulator [Anaerolineales bacterium]|nr:response regulator [Anaerolineales bacterium]